MREDEFDGSAHARKRERVVALGSLKEGVGRAGIGEPAAGEARPLEAIRQAPTDAPRLVLMHNPGSFPDLPPGSAPLSIREAGAAVGQGQHARAILEAHIGAHDAAFGGIGERIGQEIGEDGALMAASASTDARKPPLGPGEGANSRGQ